LAEEVIKDEDVSRQPNQTVIIVNVLCSGRRKEEGEGVVVDTSVSGIGGGRKGGGDYHKRSQNPGAVVLLPRPSSAQRMNVKKPQKGEEGKED